LLDSIMLSAYHCLLSSAGSMAFFFRHKIICISWCFRKKKTCSPKKEIMPKQICATFILSCHTRVLQIIKRFEKERRHALS
jgi:hypothetical protein